MSKTIDSELTPRPPPPAAATSSFCICSMVLCTSLSAFTRRRSFLADDTKTSSGLLLARRITCVGHRVVSAELEGNSKRSAMAVRRLLLPALWSPTTAICGSSRYLSTPYSRRRSTKRL
jgi:hypothetical protein